MGEKQDVNTSVAHSHFLLEGLERGTMSQSYLYSQYQTLTLNYAELMIESLGNYYMQP